MNGGGTSDAVGGDLALLHGLEEGGLGLRAGPVDLVADDDVGEDRTRLEAELGLLAVPDADAGHIRRQEVGRELDPVERAVDGPCDGLREEGLADPGDVLDEHVSFGEEGREHQLDDVTLSLDDGLDVAGDRIEPLGEPRDDLIVDRRQFRSLPQC